VNRPIIPTVRISIIGFFLYALGAAAAASAILLPSHGAAPDRPLERTLTAVARSAAGNSAAAATLETGSLLLAPQDTFLNIDTTNYSNTATLATYTWPDHQTANAILMKFDLSALPVGAVVTEATLQLALVDTDLAAESTYTVTAHKVLGKNAVIAKATGYTANGVTAWTPNGCCDNGVPLAQGDISPAYDTEAIDQAPGFKVWTITTMVHEWLLEPATNFGLVLNADAVTLRDRYRIFASMEHPDANLHPFLKVTFAAADVTPPSVVITTPPAGAVSGTVPLAANATDNVAVAGVQFQLNGTPVGPERTAYPYVLNWDTTTVSDGSYTLMAMARDWAGNAATAAVSVTVKNGILLLSPQDTYLNIDATNHSSDTTARISAPRTRARRIQLPGTRRRSATAVTC
jgi:Big-like domain-containing protein